MSKIPEKKLIEAIKRLKEQLEAKDKEIEEVYEKFYAEQLNRKLFEKEIERLKNFIGCALDDMVLGNVQRAYKILGDALNQTQSHNHSNQIKK